MKTRVVRRQQYLRKKDISKWIPYSKVQIEVYVKLSCKIFHDQFLTHNEAEKTQYSR